MVSTPASKSAIAALCLSTCGEILFLASDGHRVEAAVTYFARRYWTASPLIRAPWTVGNSAVLPRLAGSPSQVERGAHRLGQWRGTFLPTFAKAADVRPRTKMHGVTIQAHELGRV